MEKAPPTKAQPIVQRTYDAPIEHIWTAIADVASAVGEVSTVAPFPPTVAPFLPLEFTIPTWQVTELIPGRKISYEWRLKDFPGNAILTFELTPQGESTHLTVTHQGLEVMDQ